MQPLHGFPQESACHQLVQNGNDWKQRILPIVRWEAKRTLSLFSAAGNIWIAPTLQKRGNPDLLQGRVYEIIGNWNRNICYRQGDIDCAHQSLTTMYFSTRKQDMESPWSNTRVFPEGGGDQHAFPEPRRPPGRETKCMGLLTDFKKEMQQTELHSCHLVHVEVPVNSFLLKQNTAQCMRVLKTAPTWPNKRKTLPQDYSRRLCVPSPLNRRQSEAKRQWC